MMKSSKASKDIIHSGGKSSQSGPVKFQSWQMIATLLLLAFSAGAMLSACAPQQKTAEGLPAEISVAEGHERYGSGAFILDVRTPEEWAEFHVEGSTLIPLAELAQRVNEVPKDREIVVVCRSGNRSQQGREILKSAGFSQVTSMAGGLTEWRSSGFPTVSGP